MTIPLLQPRRIRRRCAVARGKSGSQNTDQRGETEERTSFDSDRHTHPGMDAALEMMFSLGEARDLELASLEDSGFGYGNILKSSGTLGNGGFSGIQRFDESATELLDLGEGVRFTTLIDHKQRGSSFHVKHVRFKIPAGVRSACGGLGK